MRGPSVIGLLVLAGCLAALVAALSPARAPAAAETALVTVKVPSGQTVAALRNQLFIQNVTCSQACDATTIVSIALSDARHLGFSGANPPTPWVQVASNYARLKAKTPTEMRFVLNAQGKKLLSKAKSGLHLTGRLTAIPRANPKTHSNVSWESVLK